jgi:hypothetical protein
MPTANQKVCLRRFIEVSELLDRAFAGPMLMPDYPAHKCGLAERALQRSTRSAASTGSAVLANAFSLTHLGIDQDMMG